MRNDNLVKLRVFVSLWRKLCLLLSLKGTKGSQSCELIRLNSANEKIITAFYAN